MRGFALAAATFWLPDAPASVFAVALRSDAFCVAVLFAAGAPVAVFRVLVPFFAGLLAAACLGVVFPDAALAAADFVVRSAAATSATVCLPVAFFVVAFFVVAFFVVAFFVVAFFVVAFFVVFAAVPFLPLVVVAGFEAVAARVALFFGADLAADFVVGFFVVVGFAVDFVAFFALVFFALVFLAAEGFFVVVPAVELRVLRVPAFFALADDVVLVALAVAVAFSAGALDMTKTP